MEKSKPDMRQFIKIKFEKKLKEVGFLENFGRKKFFLEKM